ncbi:MAG: sugar ABC transporter permease [Firmicutes bacterium]|nr:sugar ABC transporter permease [Bacillota bacterium]
MGIALGYMAPGLLLLGLFLFYPAIRALWLSLSTTDLDGKITGFVGVAQYRLLFTSPAFWTSLRATLLFAVIVVPSTLLVAMGLALLADRELPAIGLFRTLFASPMAASVSAAALIFQLFYNPASGVLNDLLQHMGLGPVPWLTAPGWALFSVALISIWMNVGFTFLLLLGGLAQIPRELYEVADLDGISPWQRLTRITLPLWSPTLFFALIVTMISSFQVFGQINILTRGGPIGATNVLVYDIYRNAFFNFQYTSASAEAMILFAIVIVLTLLQFRIGERRVFYR